MLWKLGAAVLAAGLVAAAAQAEEYTDTKAGYRVTIPEGWTQTKHKGDDDLVVTSPNTRKTFGFCFVHDVPLPGTEGLSQADLDERLTGKFPKSYWQAMFEQSDFESLVVEDAGEEKQNGRNTYFAVVTYKELRRNHKFKTVVHILPGRSLHLTCNAYLEAYPREETAFEIFFDSFFPIDRGLISKGPERSVTLSSAPANTRQPNAETLAKQISAAISSAVQRSVPAQPRD